MSWKWEEQFSTRATAKNGAVELNLDIRLDGPKWEFCTNQFSMTWDAKNATPTPDEWRLAQNLAEHMLSVFLNKS